MAASVDAEIETEIHRLSDSIVRTLTEVATIRHPLMDDDRVLAAVDELDAIVTATEVATQQILDATERLDEMREPVKGTEAEQVLDDIMTAIFEASNFQDITGQRISKVMALLRDVDLRVMAMIEHLGGETAFAHVPPPAAKEGDAALMNGPQADHEALGQNAIDNLFD